ncbi:MAG: extracellular solute-binding protein [Rhizobiaceae bacterium]
MAASAVALTALMNMSSAQAEVLFWSTQAQPVEESQKVRDTVLKGFEGGADYQASEAGPWLTRMQAELQAGTGTIGVLGGLHGDLTSVTDGLVNLEGIDASSVAPNVLPFGKLGTAEQKYMPWMQATFLMVANKKALQYLPQGADINALTYDQLIEWSKAMAAATGGPKFGFPAGPKGLKHRFFQGFMLPAYTGGVVTTFRSPEAEAAWGKFKELWAVTNPASTNYNFMQEQLLSEEVWLAFDHVARIAGAFNEKPDDFVAFPAPAGPKGRAYMQVIAGVGIPKSAPDMAASKALVAYMLKPETQVATLRATNFFPVVDVKLPDDMPASVKASGAAIAKMTASADALPALLPLGLGAANGEFNQAFNDTFERIVLGGQDVRAVLDEQGKVVSDIMVKANAKCWAPDPASTGPCPVN